jgi:ABC-type multidrug transport system fused ATPase/permease subunit
MKKYLIIVNWRTLVALVITGLTTHLTLVNNFQYNFDLTMISIAIIFPLVFTIKSAFRRREKAIEHLAKFKSGLITVNACLQSQSKISEEEKEKLKSDILNISKSLKEYLGPEPTSLTKVQESAEKITVYIQKRHSKMKFNASLKIQGFMRDVLQGIENTAAIKEHRTPNSIRAYCLLFIYLYPIIYIPSVYFRLLDGGTSSAPWVLYTLALISTFVLISLFNVQEQLENPFDQDGIDDVKLEMFDLSE